MNSMNQEFRYLVNEAPFLHCTDTQDALYMILVRELEEFCPAWIYGKPATRRFELNYEHFYTYRYRQIIFLSLVHGGEKVAAQAALLLFTQFLDLIGTLPQPKSLFRYEFTSPTSLDRSQKHHVEIFFHPKMAAVVIKRLKEKERKRSSKSDKPPQTISVVEYDEPRGEIAGYEEEAVAEILAAEIVHGKPYTCPADKPSKGKEVAKADQIFNYLLKDKQIKLPDGHRMPAAEELKQKRYCKWHNSYTHATVRFACVKHIAEVA